MEMQLGSVSIVKRFPKCQTIHVVPSAKSFNDSGNQLYGSESSGISSDFMQRRIVCKNKRSRLSTVCLHESIPIPYPIVLLIACTRLTFTGFWQWYRNKGGEAWKCGRYSGNHILGLIFFAVAPSKITYLKNHISIMWKWKYTFWKCYFHCVATSMALWKYSEVW